MVVVFTAIVLLLGMAGLSDAAARPNLIFMITDDQDAVFDSVAVMPEYLRRMRDGGMEMTNAFVAAPKCCPSRTSLLSGKFPHSLNDQGLGWCGNFIPNHVNNTFITRLKNHGYRTGLFGKVVNDMGGMCKQQNPFIPAGFNLEDGDRFVAMCNEVTYYKNTFNVNGKFYTTGTGPSDYLTSFIGNHTVDWLQTVARQAASGGPPFFAYIAPHAPHFPAEPAPWYLDAPLPSQQVPRVPSYNSSGEGKNWAIRENPSLDHFTMEGVDKHYRNRLRTLLSVDDLIAAVFKVLEDTGTLDNTYVITTSDHGYHLGNFRVPFEKSLPYETDIRVPFYVRGPTIAAGSKQAALVSLMDVGATLLELGGVVPPGNRSTDGRSLVPLFAGPAAGWRDHVLVEFFGVANQWMRTCDWVFNMSNCPSPRDASYLIDGPQNTYAMLRVINASADLAYAEYRPITQPPSAASTNWTEAYNVAVDAWELHNAAQDGSLPPATLKALSEQLWSVANCALADCP